MKHPSNRELFAHWNERRGGRLAPERTDIEPAAIRHVLGDTFVLAADDVSEHPFRLAGTRLCALFGRELKGESFVRQFRASGRSAVRELIAAVLEERTGVVASVTGRTEGEALSAMRLELVLLPLAHRNRADARLLGAMAPMSAPYWPGARPVGDLMLGAFQHIGPTTVEILPSTAVPPITRTRRGLMVYDGGRAD